MASTIGEFDGFPRDAFAFYADLMVEGNNTRSWFDANRPRYEGAVRLPMEQLLDRAARDGFGDGKVFRPNRDVRFSKDKRPYKEHCGAVILFRDGSPRASRYVQVGADGLLAATGYWELSRDQLDRFRRAVADDRKGSELERLVGEVRDAGMEVLGSELKRGPRDHPLDHPRIELLRHTRLGVSRSWSPDEPWLSSSEAYDRVAATWREGDGIAAWLETHVGAAVEPRRRRGG